ncbi:hypothetical protein D9756_001414 [Leucocoprinus leucothites]|uniref:DUF7918 domain-containing protein n=1 Tax=Leucocoprinus leucothites TaxID=201217 RepID=A0A8H5G3Z2_9AGAR|nr:hypothetical protein D9756_001414 [Leucoagaricus leucothites]
MLNHRGFSAWVVVDGRPLPEYLVAVDSSANRVSCWIPSEEGKAFSVYWKDHGGKVETCGYITLDGYLAPGRFLHGEGTAWRGGVRTGPASERPFIFQKIEENDSSLDNSIATNKDVGTILLRIKRVRLVAAASPNAIQQLPENNGGRNGIRVGFGVEQPTFEQYPSTWKVESYDNPGQSQPSTYVSFVFRYRTYDFLRVQGIIEDLTPRNAPLQSSHQRRVASMPISVSTINSAPGALLTAKNTSTDPVYLHLGSQRVKRSDSRRAVSMQGSIGGEEDEDEENPVNYPGEGLIIFPSYKRI